MKIGVISDTHVPERAIGLPSVVLEAFKHVDMVIHAGDLVDLGVLSELSKVCNKVIAVRGNMDEAGDHSRLPQKEIIRVNNYKIGVMHGWGHPNKLKDLLSDEFKNDDVDVIIFGHSHIPLSEKIGRTLFFNPGSPTDKIFAPYNSYGIIEITDKIEAKIVRI